MTAEWDPAEAARLVAELRAEVAAKQRGFDDLHAMLPGPGDIWSKVDQLRAEVERMRPVVEAAGGWRPEAFRQGIGDPRPTMAATNLAVAYDDYVEAKP